MCDEKKAIALSTRTSPVCVCVCVRSRNAARKAEPSVRTVYEHYNYRVSVKEHLHHTAGRPSPILYLPAADFTNRLPPDEGRGRREIISSAQFAYSTFASNNFGSRGSSRQWRRLAKARKNNMVYSAVWRAYTLADRRV